MEQIEKKVRRARRRCGLPAVAAREPCSTHGDAQRMKARQKNEAAKEDLQKKANLARQKMIMNRRRAIVRSARARKERAVRFADEARPLGSPSQGCHCPPQGQGAERGARSPGRA